jgi:hypothetical protein
MLKPPHQHRRLLLAWQECFALGRSRVGCIACAVCNPVPRCQCPYCRQTVIRSVGWPLTACACMPLYLSYLLSASPPSGLQLPATNQQLHHSMQVVTRTPRPKTWRPAAVGSCAQPAAPRQTPAAHPKALSRKCCRSNSKRTSWTRLPQGHDSRRMYGCLRQTIGPAS